MDSIADLLAKRRPEEPPEIKLIKDYVRAQFKESVGVLVRERDIVVTVRSSALAGALHSHAHRISQALSAQSGDSAVSKRLIFRVGA